MKHQFARRPFEHPLQDVPNELPLCFRRRLACLVNVGPLLFVSADGTFGGHNLQKLENRGVAKCFMDRDYYEEFRIVNENLRTGLPSRPCLVRGKADPSGSAS